MPSVPVRFKALTSSFAAIAADLFAGRFAWITDISRVVWYYTASSYAILARRDVLETFAGGIQDSTLTNGQALVAGASGRIQSQDAATFRGTIGAAAGIDVANRLLRVPGLITGEDADSIIANGIYFGFNVINAVDANWGVLRVIRAPNDVGDLVWQEWRCAGYTFDGIAFNRFSADFGATWSPWKSLIGTAYDVAYGGITRISTSGTANLASAQVSNLSGSGTRPLVADASGNIDDQDAATFRATIGALGITGAVSQLLKAQTNNAWSNTGPSTPIFHSYQSVYWDGCKLFSADGATEYGTFNGGSSSTGKESSTPSLSAYPAVTLSGADLQIQRDLAAYLGTLAKPTFLGSGTKFGDGGGVLLFPRVGASSAFPGIATGYGNAPISGGGALVASFVDDDTDQDDTTAPATWNANEFRTNGALVVAGGRSELASSSVAKASTGFSGNQTIAYSTLESRWVYTGSGGHTITLPTSGSGGGNVAPTSFAFQVTHNGIGLLTVAVGHASHSIDGASNVSLYPGMSVTVHAMSTTLWAIVAGEVAVTREMVIQPLPITNAAPGVVTVGPSGSMRSFGFDGVTQVEELFYHIDVQHDYVAGTDIVVHVHWMPSTTGVGNVVWKWDYQWVQAGGTFPAPTTAACPAVAAGGTAWVDKRSEVTLSGTGKTYNSRLLLRLYRDPADAGDTYAADAVLSSIGVHYIANPLQIG